MVVIPNVEVCRVIRPVDANPAGNLHGGVVLQLLEEAGYICASKHCNLFKNGGEISHPVLGRIERTHFLKPGQVGNLIIAKGEIIYASSRSLRVMVNVYCRNVDLAQTLINKAVLWYINGLIDEKNRSFLPLEVPILDYVHKDHENSHEEYLRNKEARKIYKTLMNGKLSLSGSLTNVGNEQIYTPAASAALTYYVPTGFDCSHNNVLLGGTLLKRMDEIGAISAVKHCRQLVVTVGVEAVEFHTMAFANELVMLHSIVTFTSQHSIDIKIAAYYENLRKGKDLICEHRLICTANFTYVAIGKDMKPTIVPQLLLTTDEERELFQRGNERYDLRKESKHD